MPDTKLGTLYIIVIHFQNNLKILYTVVINNVADMEIELEKVINSSLSQLFWQQWGSLLRISTYRNKGKVKVNM